MKKTLFFLVVVGLCSCGQPDNTQTAAVSATPRDSVKKPELSLRTETPTVIAVTKYQHTETLRGKCDGGNCAEDSFDLLITMKDASTHTVSVQASDYWQPGNAKSMEGDADSNGPVNTANLKKLFSRIKGSKPGDFSITLSNDKITKVVLSPVIKNGKNGTVGDFIAEKAAHSVYPDQPRHEQKRWSAVFSGPK